MNTVSSSTVGRSRPTHRTAYLPRLLGVLGVLAVLPVTTSADEPWTTPEFLAAQASWKDLAAKQEPLTVEGRIASIGARLLKLRKCDVLFRPPDGKDLDLPPRDAERVAVVGRLERQGDRFVFVVGRLTALPSDADVFALKKSAADPADAADWYALADWADGRGGFYDDAGLRAGAADARRRGLAIERSAADGPDTLAALAAKAAGFGFDDLKTELLHEALRRRWDAVRADGGAEVGTLPAAIARDLPGADAPLPAVPQPLAAEYEADPVGVYGRADPKGRPTLHRLFYVAAKRAEIERAAAADGRDGEAVAAKLAAALPELAALADEYRDRGLTYRLDRIASATQAEAVSLADRLRERGRDRDAAAAIASWLAAREASLRRDGPGGLVRAAEDRLSVAGDEAAAARLLLEADALNPGSQVVAAKLAALGYVRLGDEWLTAEAAAARPVDPVTAAMREGRVAAGMSPEQVRKTLGKPDRLARSVSTTQVHEVWQYGEPGRGGLAVHFLRYTAAAADPGRVVALAPLTP